MCFQSQKKNKIIIIINILMKVFLTSKLAERYLFYLPGFLRIKGFNAPESHSFKIKHWKKKLCTSWYDSLCMKRLRYIFMKMFLLKLISLFSTIKYKWKQCFPPRSAGRRCGRHFSLVHNWNIKHKIQSNEVWGCKVLIQCLGGQLDRVHEGVKKVVRPGKSPISVVGAGELQDDD